MINLKAKRYIFGMYSHFYRANDVLKFDYDRIINRKEI